jgi:hypothetical protein
MIDDIVAKVGDNFLINATMSKSCNGEIEEIALVLALVWY